MYFGSLDKNLDGYLRDKSRNTLLLSSNKNETWTFDFKAYSFGNNYDIEKQQNFSSFPFTFHPGFNGFGMPLGSYFSFSVLLAQVMQEN